MTEIPTTIADFLGGHIEVASVSEMPASPFFYSGKEKALVTCTKERLQYHPEIPLRNRAMLHH